MDGLPRSGHILIAVEGRVLNAIPVDLADVEVFFHLGDVGGGDAVGGAPDAGGGCWVLGGWC